MRENTVKSAWKAGRATVGAWLSIPSSYSAELMAHQGFDWLCIDMQHGVIDYRDAVAMLTAIPGSVMPTIDEFGDSVAPLLGVTAQVSGGGPSESFVVDVDMGPSMVTASGQNVAHIFGQPLPSLIAW